MSHVTRKPVFRSLRPGMTQTGRLSYRDFLEAWNLAYRNYKYYTKLRITKAQIRLRGCAGWSVPCRSHTAKTGFLMTWLIYHDTCSWLFMFSLISGHGENHSIPVDRIILLYLYILSIYSELEGYSRQCDRSILHFHQHRLKQKVFMSCGRTIPMVQ